MSISDLTQRDQLPDEELVTHLAAGERWPMAILYDRYVRLVFSLAVKMLNDEARAEDIVQEVFVRVWRSAHSFQPGRGSFVNWLLGIAHHRAIDELRRLQSRSRQARMIHDDHGMLKTLAHPGPGPAEEAWVSEERAIVRQALDQLPPSQRQVIELAYFGGLTQQEIAAHTGTPLGTVKTRVRLGLQKLKDLMTEERTGPPGPVQK